jgi:hypothetical protein
LKRLSLRSGDWCWKLVGISFSSFFVFSGRDDEPAFLGADVDRDRHP